MNQRKRSILGAASSAAFALALAFGAREALAAPAAAEAGAAKCIPSECERYCRSVGYPSGYCNGTTGTCICYR